MHGIKKGAAPPKSFSMSQLAEKLMATVFFFWDNEGILMINYKDKDDYNRSILR